MSHGNLSPRQKMINMMYLILTALLAMNVSAEILNAFVLVNDSLIKTEDGIKAKNDDIYAEFANKYEANKNKVGPWKEKSDKVLVYSNELVEYITSLQKDIIVGADEDYELFLKEKTNAIQKKDDRENPLRVMLEEKVDGELRAVILKKKLEDYRKNIALVLKDVNGGETLIETMNKNLSTDDIVGEGGDTKTWERANFEQLPLVAVITMLTKLKTDILNTEYETVNKLYTQIEAKSYKFTDLNAIVKADKGYVLSGETYTAQIFVGASDTTQRPSIQLENGTLIDSFDSKGRGIYSVKTSGYGIFPLKGKIFVNKPGSTELDSFPFETEYQVAAPSVSVSPTKMNVFYIGVDNPVDITAAGTPADQIGVSISGGGGSIRKVNSGSYIVRVKTPTNKCNVTVSANGRGLGTKTFRVKTVPSPITTIGAPGTAYYQGGNIPKSTLLALSGINATMENFDFELSYAITQFIVTCNIGGFDESAKSSSRGFTPQQKSIIQKARAGSRVIIEEVKARGPDGTIRKINDLVLKLK